MLDAVERAAEEILIEAENEAQRRLDAADARAERLLQERAAEVAEHSDALIGRADLVRERTDALLQALDKALTELGPATVAPSVGAVAPEDPQVPSPSTDESSDEYDEADSGSEPLRSLREKLSQIGRPPQQVPLKDHSQSADERSHTAKGPTDERRRSQKRPTPPSDSDWASEGAVLLATQMMVAGASHDQIESRLRDDFGIENPASILDRMDA